MSSVYMHRVYYSRSYVTDTPLIHTYACLIIKPLDVFSYSVYMSMCRYMYTGNAASSMFGGFGGCALIPNTILNNRQGGESYVSSLAYAFSILLSVLLFAPMIGQVPMAALAGMSMCLCS